jgi:starvation-inducible DNA-binding protein
MQDYVAGATIPAVKDVTDGAEAVRHCAAAFGVLLVRERALLAMSDKANDEGTNALMSETIREQEKTSWMLRAYLA